MCLLAILYHTVEDAPIVIAANREEAYSRPATAPQILPGRVAALAGIDQQAGGTWLGVNQHGVVAAVTNRRKSRPPAKPRSRGLLCRELLGCTTAREAAKQAIEELERRPYAGCNVLVADAASADVIQWSDWLRVTPLASGVHVITSGDPDDPTDRRAARAMDWLAGQHISDAKSWIEALRGLCRDHGQPPGEPPICLHRGQGGTVSSSVLALGYDRAASVYRHAAGPPCTTPYEDYSGLLGGIL